MQAKDSVTPGETGRTSASRESLPTANRRLFWRTLVLVLGIMSGLTGLARTPELCAPTYGRGWCSLVDERLVMPIYLWDKALFTAVALSELIAWSLGPSLLGLLLAVMLAARWAGRPGAEHALSVVGLVLVVLVATAQIVVWPLWLCFFNPGLSFLLHGLLRLPIALISIMGTSTLLVYTWMAASRWVPNRGALVVAGSLAMVGAVASRAIFLAVLGGAFLVAAVGECRASRRCSLWAAIKRLASPWAETTGLVCTQCGYSLLGLSENRCPECGRAFTLDEVGLAAADPPTSAIPGSPTPPPI